MAEAGRGWLAQISRLHTEKASRTDLVELFVDATFLLAEKEEEERTEWVLVRRFECDLIDKVAVG